MKMIDDSDGANITRYYYDNRPVFETAHDASRMRTFFYHIDPNENRTLLGMFDNSPPKYGEFRGQVYEPTIDGEDTRWVGPMSENQAFIYFKGINEQIVHREGPIE